MSTGIESRLRRAFIANGGTEEEFEVRKSDLLSQYRDRAAIDMALQEANAPLTLNDALREMASDPQNDGLRRVFANQKGNPDAA